MGSSKQVGGNGKRENCDGRAAGGENRWLIELDKLASWM